MSQQQPFLLENDERFSNLSPIHDEIERGAGEDDFVSFSVIDSSEQGHWFEVVKHDAREIYQIVKALAFREVFSKIILNFMGYFFHFFTVFPFYLWLVDQ